MSLYEVRIPSLSHQSTILSYCPCNPQQRLCPWECSRPLASACTCSESEGWNLVHYPSWRIVDTSCQNLHWAAVAVSEAHGTTNNEITYWWHICKVMHHVACWSYPLLLGLICEHEVYGPDWCWLKTCEYELSPKQVWAQGWCIP